MSKSASTIRSLLLLALVGASGTLRGQEPKSPQQEAPAPRGKVLFERHEPVESTPAVPDSTLPATGQAPTGSPQGSSSSGRHSRTTLRRRDTSPSSGANLPADSTSLPEGAADAAAATPQGESTSSEDAAAPQAVVLLPADIAAARQVSAADRLAVAISSTDLDLHLNTHTGAAEVRAQVQVRNAGSEPLKTITLRVSGALRWESVRLQGAPAPLRQYRVADDLDHTGLATEIAVELPTPLAPGAVVPLDLYYSGSLLASAQRLLALGAPAGRAALTDWDTVTDTFTGLRGLGNVLWYPATGATALLGNGNAVTDAVDSSRARDGGSRFHLHLTLEYTGTRPDAAFFCGERQPLVPLVAMDATAIAEGGVVTAEWTKQRLGPHTPSLFVANGAPQEVANGLLRVVTDRADTAAAAGEAAARIQPMLAEWLGAAPQRPLDMLDLPIPGATGFSDGSLLVAPLTTAPTAALAPALVPALAAAWLPPGIQSAWLRDGLPAFLQAVWMERTAGRAAALTGLASASSALRAASQSAESTSSSSSQAEAVSAAPGPPLATCVDPSCARIKAAYVFEMLRDMLGDGPLQQAISGWAQQASTARNGTAAGETAALETLLQQVAGTRKLDWFFSNWIDADHGLPELRIVTVAPRRVERSSPVNYLPQARKPVAGPIGAEPVAPTDPRDMSERDAAALAAANGGGTGPAPGSWLVAVEVQNSGSADAEVPVTVRSGGLTNTLPLHVPAHGRATIRVPFEADPQDVSVNDGSVPEVRTSEHRLSLGALPAQH